MSSSESDNDIMLWEDSEDDCDEELLTFHGNVEAAAVAVGSLLSKPKKRGGSVPWRKSNINRYFQQADEKLFRDYFAEDSIYDEEHFRRRFRMNKGLFIKLIADVERQNPYFQQKIDAVGKIGLSARQKCTAAMRILAYGSCADSIDEFVRIGESTALKTLKEFCKTIDNLYGATYLRSPNARDIKKMLEENESRGFPGMLGSLDCTHWQWKNCPTAWTGQFTGKEKKPTIILEAVASQNLHIWHAFFGMPGSCNDINVLDRSTLFQELYNGTAPPVSYVVNGRRYEQCYYLADGIYPHLATLVQTISAPVGDKKKVKCYKKCYEKIQPQRLSFKITTFHIFNMSLEFFRILEF
ncbi:uncharacterized protein LOC128092379 [Culex pipiens pallens]|uniref:uncharacterized protein LOC128092379 n=1 Tax=Culex pipiens pallens TaxID=42434 RepID=UPI0022AA46D4|nr:uncharacterized protein LOC128092379 [Culex pipiens pallens]